MSCVWLRACFVAMFVLLSQSVEAIRLPEAPLFKQMTREDGLPSTHVNAMVEDKAGYMWIATYDGLARYDGVGFEVFRHDLSDPASLPSNSVQTVYVDHQNRVWIGTEGGGLSVRLPGQKDFQHFNPKTDPRFELVDVWAIASQPDGVLWFGGYGGGVYRFNIDTDELQVFRANGGEEGGLHSDHILDILVAPDERVFIATTTGLSIYEKGVMKPAPPFKKPNAGLSMVLSVVAEPDGTILAGTLSGIERLRDGEFFPEFESLQDEKTSLSVQTMMRDRWGTLWVGTQRGLRNVQGDHVHDSAAYSALATGEMVMDILEDHEGGIWVAVRNVGLMRLMPNWRNFSVLRKGNAAQGGLISDGMTDSYPDSKGGLWLVHREGGLEHVSVDGKIQRFFDTPETRFPWGQLSSVLARADGKVWIGHPRGISLADPSTGKATHWLATDENSTLPRGMVRLLRQEKDGTLWMSIYGSGIQTRDLNGNVLNTWLAGKEGGLPQGSVEDMQFGPDGRMWVAGDFGVMRHDAEKGFVRVTDETLGRVMGMAFSPEGELWTARLGYFDHFDVVDGRLERLDTVSKAEGLPAVDVGGMVVDHSGDVWATSIRGLWRFRPETRELRRFGVSDGLPSDEFSILPPLISPSGVIVGSTAKGVVLFDPRLINNQKTAPRLVLDELSVLTSDGRSVLDPEMPVLMAWDDRELTSKARLLSFVDAPSHRYRFRLRGFEKDWVDVGSRGERVFSHLPSGNYVLEIVGANAEDVWSPIPIRLPIRVMTPWWFSPWAYLAYGLLMLMAIVSMMVLYRRRLKVHHTFEMAQRQREWAERASQAKSSFLATMGHEIRTPMTGVLGMSELLMKSSLDSRQRGYVEAIRRSGDLMLRLVNDALDLARIEAGKFELTDEPYDLHAVLEHVAQLMFPLAERKGIALSLTLAEGAPRWLRGDAQRVQQIILNLTSNAVKFTAEGMVTLSLSQVSEAVVAIAVRDTGPGLDNEQQRRLYQRFEQGGHFTTRQYGGSGLGLAISQELAGAMGGRIDVESRRGEGATFTFTLPYVPAKERTTEPAQDVPVLTNERYQVLLVEDDAVVAQVVSELLRGQGHHVVHAPHGLAALSELNTQRFSLVILDLDLPGLGGIELARLVSQSLDSPPMVALTARADAEAETQTLASGMKAFLRKPITGEQLALTLHRYARKG